MLRFTVISSLDQLFYWHWTNSFNCSLFDFESFCEFCSGTFAIILKKRLNSNTRKVLERMKTSWSISLFIFDSKQVSTSCTWIQLSSHLIFSSTVSHISLPEPSHISSYIWKSTLEYAIVPHDRSKLTTSYAFGVRKPRIPQQWPVTEDINWRFGIIGGILIFTDVVVVEDILSMLLLHAYSMLRWLRLISFTVCSFEILFP
jgi:hypothetical protein